MSRREDIDNAIWSDPDFEALSQDATILYFWSFTNPRCGMAGIYKVSLRAMAESKVPEDRLQAALDELGAASFARYEDGVLFIRTRVKHLRQKTIQIAKSIASDVAKIPNGHPLKALFLQEYGSASWLAPFIAHREAHATVGGPSASTPFQSQSGRPSSEGPLTLHGNGNGNGYGKGTGKGGRGSGGNHDARIAGFVAAYLPDADQHASEKAVRQAVEHGACKTDAEIAAFIERWWPDVAHSLRSAA